MTKISAPNANLRRRITVLGSTGSIGVNTLNLVEFARAGGDGLEIEALTAYSNVELLAEQAKKFRPKYVAIGNPELKSTLESALAGEGIEIGAGADAITEAANRDADWVMAAIVGSAGLKPTFAAARRGANIALANKECLVCAGDVLTDLIRDSGATLLPVDSEHNAIFQVFDFKNPERISKLILTASGGPFRNWSTVDMASVSPAQAIAHPNWRMGAKISVDSATMMNKGLELIEAAHIFPIPHERIDILVHPQSVIHSMVEYEDGSVLAQLGTPDMRTPIAYTLAWPERMSGPSAKLDLAAIGQLTFEAPDELRFPALRLAREAIQIGGCLPAALNAANEVAVAAFLSGGLKFLDIATVTEQVLERTAAANGRTRLHSLDEVLEVDRQARRLAGDAIASRAAA